MVLTCASDMHYSSVGASPCQLHPAGLAATADLESFQHAYPGLG